MKSSISDFLILGVLAIGGYSVYKMINPSHPQTLDECANLLERLPEPYLDEMLAVFNSKKRGKDLSIQIDEFANRLESKGFKDEAKCFRDFKPQITADIESAEVTE